MPSPSAPVNVFTNFSDDPPSPPVDNSQIPPQPEANRFPFDGSHDMPSGEPSTFSRRSTRPFDGLSSAMYPAAEATNSREPSSLTAMPPTDSTPPALRSV